ncbi:hypothetical protein BJF78_21840 [Pseudonocardia sp. CNS-139]|nr:hypothetical protein BJF78_21840 [Pseudonocardia sp. CNS-139]
MAFGRGFRADPGAAVRVEPGMPPVQRWLVAVVLGGQGRYAAAATVLHGLLAGPQVSPDVAAHAAVTLAAHRRQVGGHAAARPLDAHGLRVADSAAREVRNVPLDPHTGMDVYAARIDALVGLAADALGTGDHTGAAGCWTLHGPRRSATRPGAAPPVLAAGGPDRLGARRGGALRGRRRRRGRARARGARARRPRRVGATRAQSRIVLAVAAAAAGTLDGRAAVAELDAAGDEAERLGLLPLVWPARTAAADASERAAGGASGTAPPTNERQVPVAKKSTTILSGDATRRRHAGITTLSVIERRCDPDGRLLLGEWTALPRQRRVV